jgi:photosystem II stability/assembly factor-like uncharacterized protein
MARPKTLRIAPERWWQHPHRASVWALATHPDHDALLVGGTLPAGSLWALDGPLARALGDAPDQLRDAAWAGASRVVLAVEDSAVGDPAGPLRVVVRDLAAGASDRVVAELPTAALRTTLTVDRAGERALVNSRRAMHLVDLATGAVRTFESVQGSVDAVVGGALSPDGALALTARDGLNRAHLFDVGAARCLMNLSGKTAGIVAACFAPTGALAAALTLDPERRLIVWNLPDGTVRFVRGGPADPPPALAFSPDGARLAVSEHGHKLVLLDAADGSVVATTKTLDGYAFRLAFARDGGALYIADGAEVHVVPLAGDAPAIPRETPAPRAFETLRAGNNFSYHTGGCVDAAGNPWIVGQNGRISTSRDDGRSWEQVALGKRPYLHGACQAADGALHAYGKHAIVDLRDGAATFAALPGKPTIVAMASSAEVTVAASYDKLYRRAHRTEAWETYDPAPLRGGWHHALDVDDRGSFFLVSGSLGKGFLARGDARGTAWERLSLDDAGALWCVVCEGARVYAGADAGAIFRSDDRGARWRRLPTPVPTGCCLSLVARGSVVYAAFDSHTVHRSDDAGERWTKVLDADVEKLVWTPSGRVLAIGAGALYGCIDPGR